MSTWLYQLNAQDWSPETVRYEFRESIKTLRAALRRHLGGAS